MVQKRDGASKVILEDPDSVFILDVVKEKLHGQMMAVLLFGSREGIITVSSYVFLKVTTQTTQKNIPPPPPIIE